LRQVSEAKTRKELIDPALKKAGSDVRDSAQVGTEIPLAEQECFAVKVARYERLRSQQREAERQVEMLFQSLLSQSFGG